MFKNITESDKIFIFKTIKAIADCLISIFIPIYILKITQNLFLAILFLVIKSATELVGNFLLKKFLQKNSLLCVILHVVPVVTTQIILNIYKINLDVVIVISILMGLAQVLYSVPINLIFAFTDKKMNVRKLEISTNVGKFIFIFTSGFLLAKVENSFLFLSIASISLYILSFIPLFSLKNTIEKNRSELQQTNIAQQKLPVHFKIFHVGMGAYQATIDNLLPLFLYVNNLSFEAVTSIMAIVELLKMFMNYVAKFVYKKDKFHIVTIISYLLFISGIVIILTNKIPFVLYITSCILQIVFPLFFVPLFSSFCNNIKDNKTVANEMLIRDIDIFSTRPFIYSSFYLFNDFFISFIIATSLSSLMFVGLIENKNNDKIKER